MNQERTPTEELGWVSRLAQAGAQREEALAELRAILVRGLHRSLRDRLGMDDATVEDVVQESLLRILDRLGQYEGRSKFTTWALTIASRVALTIARRRRAGVVSLDAVLREAEFVPERAVDPSADPASRAEQQAILETLHEIIQTGLTERQRIGILAELRGVSQEELARQLGTNRNALYKLTHDARRRLKRGLEEAGYTAEMIWSSFNP
jgi:RNA polymerase sigma-70 factor (ECF subfamily)